MYRFVFSFYGDGKKIIHSKCLDTYRHFMYLAHGLHNKPCLKFLVVGIGCLRKGSIDDVHDFLWMSNCKKISNSSISYMISNFLSHYIKVHEQKSNQCTWNLRP